MVGLAVLCGLWRINAQGSLAHERVRCLGPYKRKAHFPISARYLIKVLGHYAQLTGGLEATLKLCTGSLSSAFY